MDVQHEIKVEEEMSQSWLDLIDEEEDALLNEAVSHTIRKINAEIRSNSTNTYTPEKHGNKTLDHNAIDVEDEENCLRIQEKPENGKHKHWTEEKIHNGEEVLEEEDEEEAVGMIAETNEIEEDCSPPLRKRAREDSVNSLPAKISRHRHNSSSSSSTNSSSTSKKKIEYETDPGTLARRQKDIDYGKNTTGYDRYIQAIPKKDRAKEHPKTPPKYVKYSRRGWDGMVRLWRKQLHAWDPPGNNSSNIVPGEENKPTE